MEAIHILLLEDDGATSDLVRRLLARALGTDTHTVTTVRLLADARQRIGPEYDVVLSDLNLPDSRGLATFHALHDVAQDVPIVVFSGLNDRQLALDAIHLGAADFYLKDQLQGETLARALLFAIVRGKADRARESSKATDVFGRLRELI